MISIFKYIVIISFLLLLSCNVRNNKFNNEDILLESISLSNKFYNKAIIDLREYFKRKSLEEPLKYELDFKEVSAIETQIINCNNLNTIEQKKIFINKFKQNLNLNVNGSPFVFVCLKIKNIDENIFDSISKNDFNRVLYEKYNNLFIKHRRVF